MWEQNENASNIWVEEWYRNSLFRQSFFWVECIWLDRFPASHSTIFSVINPVKTMATVSPINPKIYFFDRYLSSFGRNTIAAATPKKLRKRAISPCRAFDSVDWTWFIISDLSHDVNE